MMHSYRMRFGLLRAATLCALVTLIAFGSAAELKKVQVGGGPKARTGAEAAVEAKPEEQPAAAAATEATAPAVDPADLPDGAELMDKTIEASGGKEAHDRIKTVVTRGTLTMPMLPEPAKTESYTTKDKKMLQVVTLPGMGEVRSGMNGDVAWEMNPMMGPRLLSKEETVAQMMDDDLSDADWRDKYATVKTTGVEEFGGKQCYVVELTPKEGQPLTMLIDKETSLPAGVRLVAQTNMGALPISVRMEDYRTTDGITIPHRQVQEMAGQEVVATTDTVEYNTEIPEETFALPAEIQALVDKQAADPVPAEGAAEEKPAQ